MYTKYSVTNSSIYMSASKVYGVYMTPKKKTGSITHNHQRPAAYIVLLFSKSLKCYRGRDQGSTRHAIVYVYRQQHTSNKKTTSSSFFLIHPQEQLFLSVGRVFDCCLYNSSLGLDLNKRDVVLL